MTNRPGSDFYEPEEELAPHELEGEAMPELDSDLIDEVAGLIEEFGLSQVELSSPTFRLAFGKTVPTATTTVATPGVTVAESTDADELEEDVPEAVAAVVGIPVSSPMTGIFYSKSNPGSPPFVQEGASVTSGQVVCLIEAMKTFNEITAPVSGKVGRIGPKDGEVVQPGDVLITILP